MFNYFFIFIFLILVSNSQAENKEKIIENLQNIQNLNFEFEQNINGKIETGNCTINYPKKIFCRYDLIEKHYVQKKNVHKTDLNNCHIYLCQLRR